MCPLCQISGGLLKESVKPILLLLICFIEIVFTIFLVAKKGSDIPAPDKF